MSADLTRLLHPKSIAVVGGGAWCLQVVRQAKALGFKGDIFRVHPVPDEVEGIAAVPTLDDLPYPPDAVYLGINRYATCAAVASLSAMGAGGAVCFASGFSEASAEDAQSAQLQSDLVAAAGDMPILGPNCYGFINAVDRVALWPDQHGCTPVDRGVAILTQSSNIAINLTMQLRSLPISFVVTCGNMAQTTQAEMAMALLDDPRVTAIGLHIEGFAGTPAWHAFAVKAYEQGIPVVALKIGTSEQAQRATVSHTASLAGSDAGARAFLDHLGIPRVDDLPTLLETLMLMHCNGALASNTLSSISCSGGEACLAADLAEQFDVVFPPLTDGQRGDLSGALGPMVSLSNPLDYHTYIWGDAAKMTAAWLPMAAPHIGLLLIVLDYPHTDASAWESATKAAIAVRSASGQPVAVVATVPELLPPAIARELLAAGVTPLRGLREALAAAQAASAVRAPQKLQPMVAGPDGAAAALTEARAKEMLARHGVPTPKGKVVKKTELMHVAQSLTPPLVLKVQGLAHKSETGGVRLGLYPDDLTAVADTMDGDALLLEEMATETVAELLVGVVRDPAHGFVLTLGAGGVLTEILKDRVSLLLPVTDKQILDALKKLRLYPVLVGYRGGDAVDLNAIVQSVMRVQTLVEAHKQTLSEIEINPLLCSPTAVIAADALIAKTPDPET